MRFSTTFAIFSALAAAAQAVNFTVLTFATVTAGKPFELSWTGAQGPVTLTLKNGNPLDLKTVSTIASGLTGNTYTWEVPSTLINLETYALEISDGSGVPNYSSQFQLIGGTTTNANTGSASQTAATGSVTRSGSATASVSSVTTTQSLSTVITESAGTTSTGVRTSTGVITRTSASAVTSPTSTPPSGAASGLSSNVALVLLAAGAFFMIN